MISVARLIELKKNKKESLDVDFHFTLISTVFFYQRKSHQKKKRKIRVRLDGLILLSSERIIMAFSLSIIMFFIGIKFEKHGGGDSFEKEKNYAFIVFRF